MMAVAFRLADIFSPDVCVFLFLVERRPCFRLFSAPSLFRSCPLSRSCYWLIGFPLLVGVTLLAPPKARIISRNKSEVRCSFIRFTSFGRSPQLSLSLVQPRNDNTNCTYTYTLYKERENVLYERDVVNTSRRHVLLTNFLRVLGFSSASFRHSHTVSF